MKVLIDITNEQIEEIVRADLREMIEIVSQYGEDENELKSHLEAVLDYYSVMER